MGRTKKDGVYINYYIQSLKKFILPLACRGVICYTIGVDARNGYDWF